MRNLIQEACQGPVRDAVKTFASKLSTLSESDLRPIVLKDFQVSSQTFASHPGPRCSCPACIHAGIRINSTIERLHRPCAAAIGYMAVDVVRSKEQLIGYSFLEGNLTMPKKTTLNQGKGDGHAVAQDVQT